MLTLECSLTFIVIDLLMLILYCYLIFIAIDRVLMLALYAILLHARQKVEAVFWTASL